MQICVCHLTRMSGAGICAAGLATDSGAHVRPLLAGGIMTRALLARNGGPFDIGHIVELGSCIHTGRDRPPELEDHAFDPARVQLVDKLRPTEFWDFLQKRALSSLAALFGPDLKQIGRSAVTEMGCGAASLGCLTPFLPPAIFVNERGAIRAAVCDGEMALNLPVTDIRMREPDNQTIRLDVVDAVGERIRAGEGVLLSMGLGRPWRREGDDRPRHWLQVNNIHLEETPCWREVDG